MPRAPLMFGWLLVLGYPLSGFALGLADPVLGGVAQRLGTKPGVATAVSVNLLLPLVAVILGYTQGSLGRAWLGALGMSLGLVIGLAIQYSGGLGGWSITGLLSSIPPVVVAATLGYALLGSLAVLVARAQHGPDLCHSGTDVDPIV